MGVAVGGDSKVSTRSDGLIVGLKCLSPLLLACCVFMVVEFPLGGHGSSLNAANWDSALDVKQCEVLAKSGGDKHCIENFNFDEAIRVLSLCCAILPLFNYFHHLKKINLAVQIGALKDKVNGSIASVAQFMVIFAIFANAVWILAVIDKPFADIEGAIDFIVILMFVLLSIVDLTLMLLFRGGDDEEKKKEFRHFFGCLFFIDTPTLAGLLLLGLYVRPLLAPGFAEDRQLLAEAVFGGSISMHVAVSQLVLFALNFQKAFDL